MALDRRVVAAPAGVAHRRQVHPGRRTHIKSALAGYAARAKATEAAVRAAPMESPCVGRSPGLEGMDLCFVLLHLIEETAHHAGHADATRELLDGATSLGID